MTFDERTLEDLLIALIRLEDSEGKALGYGFPFSMKQVFTEEFLSHFPESAKDTLKKVEQ